MDDRDICFIADRPGAVNFIAWDRGQAGELIESTLLGRAKTDTSDGILSGADVMAGGIPYMAFQDGLPVVLVVLEKAQFDNGRELMIHAAIAVSGRRDATETVLPEIEKTFGADCDSIAVQTRRGGLVRKLARAGYHEAAIILRKKK